MSAKFTPGPYEAHPLDDSRDSGANRFFVINAPSGTVASVYPGKEAEATARLFAAALEMLETLKQIRAEIDSANANTKEQPVGASIAAKLADKIPLLYRLAGTAIFAAEERR